MSIGEVPVLPLRAGRHLAAWIVWHAVGVSLVEDASEQIESRPRSRRRKRSRTRSAA